MYSDLDSNLAQHKSRMNEEAAVGEEHGDRQAAYRGTLDLVAPSNSGESMLELCHGLINVK